MPIPKPKGSEIEQEFMSRCMADDKMNNEFPQQEQRVAVCYNTYRTANKMNDIKIKIQKDINKIKKHLERIETIEKYNDEIEEVKKVKTIEGYESPEPGSLPNEGADLLARIYSKCRSDGKDKEYCARVAWTAVNNAGYKSLKIMKKLKKAQCDLTGIIDKIKKQKLVNDK
jgi:predicted RND superfamily exporter protein